MKEVREMRLREVVNDTVCYTFKNFYPQQDLNTGLTRSETKLKTAITVNL